MKKISIIYALCSMLLLAPSAHAIAIFSTSTDWEAVTGLRMSEFRIEFGRDRNTTNTGMELYFLDGFPCFGQSESARAWISPTNSTFSTDNAPAARMRIICLYAPEVIKFAYREVARGASQGRTTGLMICPVTHSGRQLRVDLRECESAGEWNDFR